MDLAGAEIWMESTRGKIDFWHDDEGLVIAFDDSLAGGAGEFVVVVRFADDLVARADVIGLAQAESTNFPDELLIEAHIDGRDELHIAPGSAAWLHLAWGWPSAVRLGGLDWNPETDLLKPATGEAFFSPGIDLERVRMKVEEGRGKVELSVHGGRLFVSFDDDAELGAADYRVRLSFPKARRKDPVWPAWKPVRVELTHELASDVLGARLHVLALSPRSGEWARLPGWRGMDASGRCVVALAPGSYCFEVLHAPTPSRLVALRSGTVRITRSLTMALPASPARTLDWKAGGGPVELQEFALHSLIPGEEVVWRRSPQSTQLELVISPGQEFSLRAFGVGGADAIAWWTSRGFGTSGGLDSTRQPWIQCSFDGAGRGVLPAGCKVELHGPTSSMSFAVSEDTRLLTNRRFVSLGYSHDLDQSRRAVFHPRPMLLPKPGRRQRLELGGELTARGSALVLYNENLGSSDARELWWELNLVDPGGHVLDTERSAVEWNTRAAYLDGSAIPGGLLDDDAIASIADPCETVVLHATYRWDEPRALSLTPAPSVSLENDHYRSLVPGHLDTRARAYLDKARRTYEAIELAIGRPGQHSAPIELKWWLNGGAVGAWGSISMPLQGMVNDHDWFAFPWALAHESLHGFG